MSPRDATFQAMEEVSGPVVSIALILASVFIPIGFMSGIQGRLNKQFAITIAISVIISAFNALTLSPALSAMLLRPRTAARRASLGRFFGAFNRGFRAGDARLRALSHALVRKAAIGIAVLVAFAVADWTAGADGCRPASCPRKTTGIFFLNVQLPPAASLERTDEVCRKIEQILGETEGIAGFNTIAGFSLLSRVSAGQLRRSTSSAFKPWERARPPRARGARPIVDRLNGSCARIVPEATGLCRACRRRFPVSARRAASRSGCRTAAAAASTFLDQNVQKFLEAARKRPELAGVATSQFSAAVPAALRRRRSRQGAEAGRRRRRRLSDDAGVSRRAVRQSVQPLRPPVARVPAGGGADARSSRTTSGSSTCATTSRSMVPLSTLVTTQPDLRAAVHQPVQRVPRRAVAGRRRARLQLRPGARRARGRRAGPRCRPRSATTGRTSRTRRRRRRRIRTTVRAVDHRSSS